MTRATHSGIAATIAFLGACRGDASDAIGPDLPVVVESSVAANPLNAISAVVAVHVRDADSVAIRFSIAGATGADSITPAVRTVNDSAAVPVLGLVASSAYVMRAVAYGSGGTSTGSPLTFATDTLPSDLPRYTTDRERPIPGLRRIRGRCVRCRDRQHGARRVVPALPDGPGLNFMAQPNGHFVALPPAEPAATSRWVEIDPLGAITRTLGCAAGLRPRLHDLIAEPDGNYWLLCDDTRTMNLTSTGGVSSARVTGTVVQHVSADGSLLFSWSAFDHFDITDVNESERSGGLVNWTHGNAIDLDADGNLIVSFRNLGEVTKIDVPSGQIIWRLGGRRNQFTFVNALSPSFIGQHSARAYAPGALLLLDNIGDPAQSRAERYVINETARTARLVQSYGSAPAVSTLIGGSVQPLAGGRTLVSFGTAGRVEEYDADRRVVWRIDGNAGYVFRAQRIRSLYAPGVSTPR